MIKAPLKDTLLSLSVPWKHVSRKSSLQLQGALSYLRDLWVPRLKERTDSSSLFMSNATTVGIKLQVVPRILKLRASIPVFLHPKQVLKAVVHSAYLITPTVAVRHTLFRHRMCFVLMFYADSSHAYNMLNMSFRCPQPCPSMLCQSQSPVMLRTPRGPEGEPRVGDK